MTLIYSLYFLVGLGFFMDSREVIKHGWLLCLAMAAIWPIWLGCSISYNFEKSIGRKY